MADLGKAYVQIVPSAKGISGSIEKELSGAGASAGKSAGESFGGSLLSGLKAVFAAAAIGKVVKDAFEAGGNLQQSFGGLETVYGEAAAGAKDYAFAAAQAGISANDFAEQSVSIGNALKQAYGGNNIAAMEAANTAIMDMADNSAKYGTSLDSLKDAYKGLAKGNYRLLDNLNLGYQEGKQEMERLLSDAEKLSGVKYDINNLGDVYSAIHVIQGELGLTGVAAGEAETTLTGSFGAMKASWENTMAALTTGQGMDSAMANLTTSVQNFANNVLAMLGQLAPQIPGFIMGIAQTAITNAPAMLSAGLELVLQMAVGLVNGIPQLIDKIPELYQSTKEAFGAVDWAQLGLDLINGIIRGIDAAVTALWNKMKEIAANALQAAKNALEIGSPSRLFADEVGAMIPAGISLGISENEDSLEGRVYKMATEAANTYERAAATPTAQLTGRMLEIDYPLLAREIAGAVSSRPVVIQGDTAKIFRVVRNTNSIRTRATNFNALGAMT